ncbi:DUF2975 domain-containing protein [Lactococcus lactis]|uniref:DUF2975 domain-containing protein n=1 Tax=Lactococcus lactis TaxID=1358 RepID=UPI000C9FB0FE|nr:DUF2975 domain-containing protein [Lactococcus lactis]AUS68874.1 DUF2975 domain-containing protein [Lactococcus lactis subsp. lactis]
MQIKTNALKLVIIILGLFIVFMFYLLIIGLIKSFQANDVYFEKLLFYIVMYVSLILSMISNIIAYSILSLIDKDILFTERAIKKVSLVKKISILTFFILLGILPMAWHIVELTKVKGVIPVAVVIVVSPLILSTFIGVMEKLLMKMVQIKSENDFTV